MNNRIEPQLLSIKPDQDQVETYKQSYAKSKGNLDSFAQTASTNPVPVKNSGGMVWFCFFAILGLASGGYALYKQNSATKAQLMVSEKRIAELERALSATGEEMGQSAGAIQAKLSAVAKRTDELWEQMDKLWASAWRRNQAEIKELKDQTTVHVNNQTSALAKTTASVQALSQTQAEQAIKMSLFLEQLQALDALKGQLTALQNELDKFKSQSQGRDSKQIEIAANIMQLEMTQKALVEQVERLEKRLTASSVTP